MRTRSPGANYVKFIGKEISKHWKASISKIFTKILFQGFGATAITVPSLLRRFKNAL